MDAAARGRCAPCANPALRSQRPRETQRLCRRRDVFLSGLQLRRREEMRTEIILDQGVEKNEVDKKGYKAYDWAMYMRRRTGGFEYGQVEAYLETYQPKIDFKTKRYQ